MLLNQKLVTLGQFDLRLNHLLVIAILTLSFSTSFLLRSQAAEFGFELNEFDPFFNFRATEYIVENGIDEYFEWNDDLSWYPVGRDVSSTSQVMLHLTAAVLYWIFGGSTELYDFAILLPVVFGSLTAIVLFALVRVIGGTAAGLFSALLYSISLPLLIRSPIGWFKSEPLGLFFSLLAVYLLLSGINSQNKKILFTKLISAGIFTSLSISAWGGNQFFIIPIGIFFFVLPFVKSEHKIMLWAIPLYATTTIFISLLIERVSSNFLFNLGGISLIISTLFLVSCILIQIKSKNKKRNSFLFLLVFIIFISGTILVNYESQFLPSPSYRYLNALNPFLSTTDPLIDSVSEHATTSIVQSFMFHSVLMVFSGIGIWVLFQNLQKKNPQLIKTEMFSFSIILGITGVYVSSTFVRLEVFASISLIVLASLGLSLLLNEFFRKNDKKKPLDGLIKISFATGIFIIFLISAVYPVDNNLLTSTKIPPTILNGGSVFKITSNDWIDSLDWIKNNTPKDSVIAAWWDYGYWISTLGERASLADNSTIHSDVIENIAQTFLDNPDDAWKSLIQMEADYVLVFVAGQKLSLESEESLYLLHGGGDESKKQWFMRIAGEDLSRYLHYDGISATDYFWQDTLLGQMIPFTPVTYVNFQTNQEFPTYLSGFEPVYVKNIKFTEDGDGPLRLVYASPSFNEEEFGPMLGVFIYEINKDYVLIS